MYGGEDTIDIRAASAELDSMTFTVDMLLKKITPARGVSMQVGSYWYSYIPTVKASNGSGKYHTGEGQSYKIFVGNNPYDTKTHIYNAYDDGAAARAYNGGAGLSIMKRNALRRQFYGNLYNPSANN
jgi:hypothetical protein